MKKVELLKLARLYHIADEGISEANLIRRIQRAEGNVDCYATGKLECEHLACRWRATCLPPTDAATAATSSSNDSSEENA